MSAPCDWPIDYAACGACPQLEANQPVFEEMAVDLLWRWSGGAFGLCESAVRPCRSDCFGDRSTFWGGASLFNYGYGPVLVAGAWYNLACGTCGDNCSCGRGPASLALPPPVYEVVSVTIDGEAVAPDTYRVDNSALLVRLDGETWPRCQDMAASPTEPGSFVITYQRGQPVPAGGQVAAGVLACELAKAAVRDPSCALPQRVQTITRQGVTVALIDAFEDVEKGRTGIWLVDSWLASTTQAPRVSRVYSVDIPRPRNRVTTWPTSSPTPAP